MNPGLVCHYVYISHPVTQSYNKAFLIVNKNFSISCQVISERIPCYVNKAHVQVMKLETSKKVEDFYRFWGQEAKAEGSNNSVFAKVFLLNISKMFCMTDKKLWTNVFIMNLLDDLQWLSGYHVSGVFKTWKNLTSLTILFVHVSIYH